MPEELNRYLVPESRKPDARAKARSSVVKTKKSRSNFVIGTSDSSVLSTVVKPRRTQCQGMFLTRVGPHETEASVTDFLKRKNKLFTSVKKLTTKHPGYASFQILCTYEQLPDLLDPTVWPKGALVKKFFAKSVPVTLESNAQLPDDTVSVSSPPPDGKASLSSSVEVQKKKTA